jgi:hypothetical protein
MESRKEQQIADNESSFPASQRGLDGKHSNGGDYFNN